MGPSVDFYSLELEDEPVAKKAKTIKSMTGEEWSILSKVFYEVRHYDVQERDPASPTDHSKARGQPTRYPPALMEASPSLSTITASSPIGTDSTIPVTPTNSPTGSLVGQSNEEELSLKRKADQDELTKRLWQKYPAVMQALEQPSIMDRIVNEAPGKKTPTSSPKTVAKKTPTKKRTPQKSRKRASKKAASTVTNEFISPEMDIYGCTPYMYHSPYEAAPMAYSWPPYLYYHHPGHAAAPFYPLPYPQPFDPLPSVNTLLPSPSFSPCDPLPVLDLSSDDLDYFHFDCSPPSL